MMQLSPLLLLEFLEIFLRNILLYFHQIVFEQNIHRKFVTMNNTSIMRLYSYSKGNIDDALYIIVCTGASAALNLSRRTEGSEGKPSHSPSNSTATGSVSRSNTAN